MRFLEAIFGQQTQIPPAQEPKPAPTPVVADPDIIRERQRLTQEAWSRFAPFFDQAISDIVAEKRKGVEAIAAARNESASNQVEARRK